MTALNAEGDLSMRGITADALSEDAIDRGTLPMISGSEELLCPSRMTPAVGRSHCEASKEETALSVFFEGVEEGWECSDWSLRAL